MSVITLSSVLYCNEEAILQPLVAQTGYRHVTDADLIEQAARSAGMETDRIAKAFSAKVSLFNPFTRDKEKAVAFLRLAAAELLTSDNLIFSGFCSQLIPASITHALRVCLVAGMDHRLAQAARRNLADKEAQKAIHKSDADHSAWTLYLLDQADPWRAALYDIVIPTDKTAPEAALALITSHLQGEALRVTEASRATAADFLLQSKVQIVLSKEGHEVTVSCKDGEVTLTIEKKVLMLNRLEQELKEIVLGVEGVRSVTTQVGKHFHQDDIYRKIEFQAPSRVLLVDDEREFVQTLSERLLLRDMGSAVVYDGESALEMVQDDEPEVMVLDLKMPGIDGMEVLRRVKETQPDIEVIILTGHGNESDREACMRLGAFAYLQKPVDIDVLSETMRQANQKIQERRRERNQG